MLALCLDAPSRLEDREEWRSGRLALFGAVALAETGGEGEGMRRNGWVRGLLAVAALAHLAQPPPAAADRSGWLVTAPAQAGGSPAPDRTAKGHFAKSYDEARAQVLGDAHRARAAGIRVDLGAIEVPSATRVGDRKLTIDWFHYRCSASASRNPGVLIYGSGTHGKEGHGGSAVQARVAREDTLPRILAKGMDVLLVHALNPQGYFSGERVTDSNVDLNRNCSGPGGKIFRIANEGYSALRPLLEPTGPLRYPRLAAAKLVAGLLTELVRTRDFAGMRQAVAAGQGESEKGLFFRGNVPAPQIEPLGRLFRDKTRDYDRVVGLDVHTGLGPRGALSIITEDDASKAAASVLVASMGSAARDQRIALIKNAYRADGTVVSLLWQRLDPAQRAESLIFAAEHGTKKEWPIPVLGPMEAQIETLVTLVLENQGRHYGYATDEVRRTVRGWFEELFNPSDPVWQAGVLRQHEVLLDAILDRYGTPSGGSPLAAR